jgi:hypothetical protein
MSTSEDQGRVNADPGGWAEATNDGTQHGMFVSVENVSLF